MLKFSQMKLQTIFHRGYTYTKGRRKMLIMSNTEIKKMCRQMIEETRCKMAAFNLTRTSRNSNKHLKTNYEHQSLKQKMTKGLEKNKMQHKPSGQPSKNGSTMSAFCSGTNQNKEHSPTKKPCCCWPLWLKKDAMHSCPQLRQMLNDFKNSFITRLSSKFAKKITIKNPITP